jgi:glucose-6-phosphate dehydrogenase assembly protein OpcA
MTAYIYMGVQRQVSGPGGAHNYLAIVLLVARVLAVKQAFLLLASTHVCWWTAVPAPHYALFVAHCRHAESSNW